MSEDTFVCTKCKQSFSISERRATIDEPYCQECFLVWYYEFPIKRYNQLKDELAKLEKKGVPPATTKKMLMGELWRHANKVIKEKLSGDFLPNRIR